MTPIFRILVPIDFSKRCLGMMPYVAAIARRYNSEVTLLHVANPLYALPAAGISEPVLIPVPQGLMAKRKTQLENLAAAEMRGISTKCCVYEGDPELQIAACSEDMQLVVMPTHGYGLFRRFLLGSVTAKVLNDVKCPVLTGAHLEEQEPRAKVEFSNIVCAVDLNPHSRDILASAANMAHDFNANLSLIHVLPPVNPGLYVSFSSRIKQEMEQMAREDVEKLKAEAKVDKASICIRQGDIDKEICCFTQSIGADLLVVGRGPHDVVGGRLRSNAYAIIRQASCPVLSV
jgi:nucleotide-binding universal stress UspA family protein